MSLVRLAIIQSSWEVLNDEWSLGRLNVIRIEEERILCWKCLFNGSMKSQEDFGQNFSFSHHRKESGPNVYHTCIQQVFRNHQKPAFQHLWYIKNTPNMFAMTKVFGKTLTKVFSTSWAATENRRTWFLFLELMTYQLNEQHMNYSMPYHS